MRFHYTHIWKISFVIGVVCVAVACSSSKTANIERGSEYNYSNYEFKEGHPEIRMSAMGFLDEQGEGRIRVSADIEDGSLVFRERDGKNTAEIEMTVTIVGTNGHSYSDSYRETKTVENENGGYLTNFDVIRYDKEMEVPPGEYKVFFAVIDKASGNETVREVDTFIPDPENEVVNLTTIQILGKDSDQPDKGYEPVTTYDVSTRKDSIRFVVQVTNNDSDDPLVVRSRLLEFEADTTAARPAHYSNYSASSLPYKGIDYGSEKELEQTQRVLDQSGSVMIEFPFERPAQGSYRFEVTADGAGEEEELFKARDFSVLGENFPRVRSPRELAEPLIYLMRNSKHEEMMAIEDPEELKEAVDRFWLENIQSVSVAREVIALYYERVEEANRLYTNFKEGWKTDRGMIYILFGPPGRVVNRVNVEHWMRDTYSGNSRYNFLFERTRMRGDYFPFDNYLLHRSQGYHNYQYQQTQLWLSGQILDTFM